MKYLIAIITFAVLAQAEIFERPCRSAQELGVKSGFNPSAFLGVWWEIERYEQRFQVGFDCVRAQYTLNSDGSINVLNQAKYINNGTSFEDEGRAVISFPDEDPLRAMLNVTFGPNQPSFSNYWVLATDYVNYAFVTSCVPLPINRSVESYWLLSRTFTINQAGRDTANRLIAQHLDQDRIRPTIQDNQLCGRLT